MARVRMTQRTGVGNVFHRVIDAARDNVRIARERMGLEPPRFDGYPDHPVSAAGWELVAHVHDVDHSRRYTIDPDGTVWEGHEGEPVPRPWVPGVLNVPGTGEGLSARVNRTASGIGSAEDIRLAALMGVHPPESTN